MAMIKFSMQMLKATVEHKTNTALAVPPFAVCWAWRPNAVSASPSLKSRPLYRFKNKGRIAEASPCCNMVQASVMAPKDKSTTTSISPMAPLKKAFMIVDTFLPHMVSRKVKMSRKHWTKVQPVSKASGSPDTSHVPPIVQQMKAPLQRKSGSSKENKGGVKKARGLQSECKLGGRSKSPWSNLLSLSSVLAGVAGFASPPDFTGGPLPVVISDASFQRQNFSQCPRYLSQWRLNAQSKTTASRMNPAATQTHDLGIGAQALGLWIPQLNMTQTSMAFMATRK
mmetsp:Transcript_100646/g.289172  ORF Transcript_100646/g.289172 Transcript_100646/m.289172 type:complete len:283 (-) Transcript_100646:1610-2458(-)